QVVFEVEGVEEGHAVDPCAEALDFFLDGLDVAEIVRLLQAQSRQLGLGLAQLAAAAARQGDTPRVGRTQGAHDVDPRWIAFVADAGAYRLEGVAAGEVTLDQVRQFQILEHEIEEFLLGDLEDEVIHAFASVAGLPGTTTSAASLWAGDTLAGDELLVAGVNDGLPPAAAVVKHRLVDIASGNADLLAMLHIGDGAASDGFLHRLLDMPTIALQEPLTVHRALVLAVQAAVDHIAHSPSGAAGSWKRDIRSMRLLSNIRLPASSCSLLRFTYPQIPFREQANLFLRVAAFDHA